MIESRRFQDTLHNLKRLLQLCREHKMTRAGHVLQTRIRAYEEVCQALASGTLTEYEGKHGEERLHELLFSDTPELEEIYLAFRNDFGDIADKMRVILGAPTTETEESTKQNEGRNILFELSVAAMCKLRGLRVLAPGGDDVRLAVDGMPVVVECKRPWTMERVRDNMESARKDLLPRIAPDGWGVIAISLTRAIARSNLRIEGATPEDMLKRAAEAVSIHSKRFRDFSNDLLGPYPRVVAYMFVCHVGGVVRNDGTPYLLFHVAFGDLLRLDQRAYQVTSALRMALGRDLVTSYGGFTL